MSSRMEGMPERGEAESPLVYNLRRVNEIIAQMQEPFRQAIAQSDGSEIHHSAEIRKLDAACTRIRSDIVGLNIYEPIDEKFVCSMVELLDVELYRDQQMPTNFVGWMKRGELVDKAFEEARSEAA